MSGVIVECLGGKVIHVSNVKSAGFQRGGKGVRLNIIDGSIKIIENGQTVQFVDDDYLTMRACGHLTPC